MNERQYKIMQTRNTYEMKTKTKLKTFPYANFFLRKPRAPLSFEQAA